MTTEERDLTAEQELRITAFMLLCDEYGMDIHNDSYSGEEDARILLEEAASGEAKIGRWVAVTGHGDGGAMIYLSDHNTREEAEADSVLDALDWTFSEFPIAIVDLDTSTRYPCESVTAQWGEGERIFLPVWIVEVDLTDDAGGGTETREVKAASASEASEKQESYPAVKVARTHGRKGSL